MVSTRAVKKGKKVPAAVPRRSGGPSVMGYVNKMVLNAYERKEKRNKEALRRNNVQLLNDAENVHLQAPPISPQHHHGGRQDGVIMEYNKFGILIITLDANGEANQIPVGQIIPADEIKQEVGVEETEAIGAGENGDVAGGDKEVVDAEGSGDAAARDEEIVHAGDNGVVAARDEEIVDSEVDGGVAAGNNGVVAAGDNGVVATGDEEIVTAGDNGVVDTGDKEIVDSEDNGGLAAGDNGVVATGEEEIFDAGDNGVVATGNEGIVDAGDNGGVAAGDNGVVAAGDEEVVDGNNSVTAEELRPAALPNQQIAHPAVVAPVAQGKKLSGRKRKQDFRNSKPDWVHRPKKPKWDKRRKGGVQWRPLSSFGPQQFHPPQYPRAHRRHHPQAVRHGNYGYNGRVDFQRGYYHQHGSYQQHGYYHQHAYYHQPWHQNQRR